MNELPPAAALWQRLKTARPEAQCISVDIAESSDHVAIALVEQYAAVEASSTRAVVVRWCRQAPVGTGIAAAVRDAIAATTSMLTWSVPRLCVADISGGRGEHGRLVWRTAGRQLGSPLGYKITSSFAETDRQLRREHALALDPDDRRSPIVPVCTGGRVALLSQLKVLTERAAAAERAADVPLIILTGPDTDGALLHRQMSEMSLDVTPSGREVVSTRGHDDLVMAVAVGIDSLRWAQVLCKTPRTGASASGLGSAAGWT